MSQYTHHTESSSDDAPARAVADEQRSWDAPHACRTGVAKITANSGAGAYTVTEQRRDAVSGTWADAPVQLGHVLAAAIDVDARAEGTVGQIVPFAEHRGAGGTMLLLIDVGSEGWKVKVSANDTTAGLLADKLVGDDGTGSNVKVTLTEQTDGGNETLKVVIAKSDLAPGYATITHSIRIVAGTAAGSHKISDDDLRGKLILHSAFGNDSSSMYADWPGCAALKTTQPICHVVGNPPAFDDQLQWGLTATGGLGLKVESTDGKLYWTWSQDNSYDQYGFCEVKVRSGTVDTTAN